MSDLITSTLRKQNGGAYPIFNKQNTNASIYTLMEISKDSPNLNTEKMQFGIYIYIDKLYNILQFTNISCSISMGLYLNDVPYIYLISIFPTTYFENMNMTYNLVIKSKEYTGMYWFIKFYGATQLVSGSQIKKFLVPTCIYNFKATSQYNQNGWEGPYTVAHVENAQSQISQTINEGAQYLIGIMAYEGNKWGI